MVKRQERSTNLFSSLWKFCQAGVSPFMCWTRPRKAVITAEEVLWRTCKPVEVPGKITRAVFIAVEVLSSS